MDLMVSAISANSSSPFPDGIFVSSIVALILARSSSALLRASPFSARSSVVEDEDRAEVEVDSTRCCVVVVVSLSWVLEVDPSWLREVLSLSLDLSRAWRCSCRSLR